MIVADRVQMETVQSTDIPHVFHHSFGENIHAPRRLLVSVSPANCVWHGYILTESLVMSSIKRLHASSKRKRVVCTLLWCMTRHCTGGWCMLEHRKNPAGRTWQVINTILFYEHIMHQYLPRIIL